MTLLTRARRFVGLAFVGLAFVALGGACSATSGATRAADAGLDAPSDAGGVDAAAPHGPVHCYPADAGPPVVCEGATPVCCYYSGTCAAYVPDVPGHNGATCPQTGVPSGDVPAPFFCDSVAACPNGTVCYALLYRFGIDHAECLAPHDTGPYTAYQLCATSAECLDGKACRPSTTIPEYLTCQ